MGVNLPVPPRDSPPPLNRWARRLLSPHDGRGWEFTDLSLGRLWLYARDWGTRVRDLAHSARGLARLGLAVPNVPDDIPDPASSAEFARLLKLLIDSVGPDGRVAAFHVARLWQQSDHGDLAATLSNLARLGIRVVGDVERATDVLSDWPLWPQIRNDVWFAFDVDEASRRSVPVLLEVSAGIRHGVRIRLSRIPLGELATRLNACGVLANFMVDRVLALPSWESQVEDDGALLRAVPWHRYEKATIDAECVWFDWARFNLWWCTEPELRERVAKLASLFADAPPKA